MSQRALDPADRDRAVKTALEQWFGFLALRPIKKHAWTRYL